MKGNQETLNSVLPVLMKKTKERIKTAFLRVIYLEHYRFRPGIIEK